MDDNRTYWIEVQGQINEMELNAISPFLVAMVQVEADEKCLGDQGHLRSSTRFTVFTDQSGLIGLIRCLHGRGIVLLSVRRER